MSNQSSGAGKGEQSCCGQTSVRHPIQFPVYEPSTPVVVPASYLNLLIKTMKEKLQRKVYYLYPSEIKRVKKMAKVRNTKLDRWSESRIIREFINK